MLMRNLLFVCLLLVSLYGTSQPSISSFSPASAKPGTLLTIKGTGFTAADSNRFVYVGPVKANILSATDTSLIITIPKAATLGKISVTINKLTTYSAKSFVPFYDTKDSLQASQFSARTNINTTLNPARLAMGDFNNDGFVDVIITDPKAGLYTVLKNNKVDTGSSTPQFTHKDITTNRRILTTATGDLDGDGKLDLVFGCLTNADSVFVTVLKNTSTRDSISFLQMQDLFIGNAGTNDVQQILLHAFINDLDLDGKQDIIGHLSTSTSVLPAKIIAFKNESVNGILTISSFSNRISVTSPVSLKSFSVADLNGDNRAEFFGLGADSGIHIFSNTSTTGQLSANSFSNRIKLSSAYSPVSSIYAEDIDNDGKPELLLLNFSSNKLLITPNRVQQGVLNTAAFDTQVSFTTGEGPSSLSLFDFTGKGKPDIAITLAGNNLISFWENKSVTGNLNTSSFITRGTLSAPINATAAAITDFNNDGGADIAVGSINLGFALAFFKSQAVNNNPLPNTSSSIVPVINTFFPASGPVGTTVTISGKNFSDSTTKNIVYFGAVRASVVAASNTQLVVTAPPSASYEPITVISNGLSASSNAPFVVTSFNADARNITTGSFAAAKYFATSGSSPRSIITEDLNNDGKPEIIVTNQASNQVSIFRNLSTISNDTLPVPSLFAGGTGTFGLATGDLNGDGKKEIVITNFNAGSSSSISVFPNTSTDSSITFGAKFDSAVGNGSTSVAIRDINNDGKADIIAISGNSSLIHYFLNTGSNGNFGFAPGKTINLIPFRADYLNIADINGDGKADIITTFSNNGSSGLRILQNTSDSTNLSFNIAKNYTIGTALPLKAITADIDVDGKPDFAFGFSGSANIYLYKNTSTIDSIKLDSILMLPTTANPGSFSFADMDGDGKPDLLVPDRDSNTVSLYPNRSTQNGFAFGNKISFASLQDPASVYGSDINGDGMPEILTANNQSGNISVLRNKIRLPKIIAFTPVNAKRLDTVLVKGYNFSRTSLVKAGDVAMSFTELSDTTIRFVVNKAAKSGSISVTNPYGTDTLNGFTYVPVPKILSFTPSNGGFGDTITITGYHFINVSAVSFGDSAALSFQIISDSLIKAVVSRGTSGNIKVSNTISTDSLSGFTYVTNPAISVSGTVKFTVKNNVASPPVTSYKLSATKLTGALNISFPQARLMVSRYADSGFQSQLIITPVNGKIDSTNIYVKLIFLDGLSDSLTINITHSSPGAENKIIPVKIFLEKDSTANITLSTPAGPLQVNAAKGIATPALFYYLNGTNLSGDIKLTAPNRFKISRSLDTGFVKELIVAPLNKRVDSVKIYIQFYSDTVYTSITDSVSHTSIGAITKYMPIKVTMQADTTKPAPNTPKPVLKIYPENKLSFIAKTGITTNVQSYKITADSITDNAIRIITPRFYQVSRQADTGFTQQLNISFSNGKLDTTTIYVRFRSDSVIGNKTDSIIHSLSNGTILKKLAVAVSNCDSVFGTRPIINQITTDGTLLCFKDSVILSVSSPGNLTQYSWSTGETTASIKVVNSAQVSVRVATQNTCLSAASPIVNLIKNTNTKPSIGITSDSILISTTAPYYRWYFNNIRTNGDTTNRLVARKVGFYRVETSANRLCWDASDDLPIVILPTTASSDTVKVRIFPNPVTGGTFTVVASLERVTNVVARVMVTDASGLVLAQTNRFIFYGREIKIPVTLSTYKGTAFVRVEINGDIETKTIILQ